MISSKIYSIPSPLTGEGQGEGGNSTDFMAFYPPPVKPVLPGEGNIAVYEAV